MWYWDIDTNINKLCCYRTPKENTLEPFLNKLEKLLDYLFDKKGVICGDFNIDVLTDSENHNKFKNLLQCYNFRYLYNCVTFRRGNNESSLDNIITNMTPDDILNCSSDDNGLSDGHIALICEIASPFTSKKSSRNEFIWIHQRNFSEKNHAIFRHKLMVDTKNKGEPDGFIEAFTETFNDTYNFRRHKINLNKKDKIRWITKGLRVSSLMKRFLNTASNVIND